MFTDLLVRPVSRITIRSLMRGVDELQNMANPFLKFDSGGQPFGEDTLGEISRTHANHFVGFLQ